MVESAFTSTPRGTRGQTIAMAIYASVGMSKLWPAGQTVERNHIKEAVADGLIKLVVATDTACEGLNLQTLGTLINIDLPWNSSPRLRSPIGRCVARTSPHSHLLTRPAYRQPRAGRLRGP